MFTLKECKDQVLSLIDEYSVDGQIIGEDENKDYLLRVPQFANKVQLEIAQKIKVPKYYIINHTSDDITLYNMPNDFWEINKIVRNDCEYSANYFTWVDRKTLKLFPYQKDIYYIHYFAYPSKFTQSSSDNSVFDICDEAAILVAFKVASMIIQPEKAEISRRLLDIYDSDLNRVINSQPRELQQVQRIYSI